MLDWLVVGGGVHGTHMAVALLGGVRARRDRVRVLDPHERPLARWDEMTAAVGMTTLRSPAVHHLGLDPFELLEYARGRPGHAAPGGVPRPSLALFRAHADHVVDRHGVDRAWLTGRAERLERVTGGWRVRTSEGDLRARRVVLAVSESDRPHWPGWAVAARSRGLPVEHVFDGAFRRDSVGPAERVVVVGGGLSAAQLALALARRPGPVSLLARHAPRIHRHDSAPRWLGPPAMREFAAIADPAERRRVVVAARNRGSMPEDVGLALGRARDRGEVEVVRGEPVEVRREAGRPVVRLADGRSVPGDRIVLATGFAAGRPGRPWLDDAVRELGLPVGGCGFPIVDPTLAWADGLHVTGALAELEIGPVARNIAGAQRASERLLRAAGVEPRWAAVMRGLTAARA